MNPITLQGLATGFIATSIAMGLPSLATLLLYAGHQIRNRLTAPTAEPNFGDNPDAILLMLKGMTQAIGLLGRAAGALGQMAMNLLAGVSVVAFVLAVALWFTGRGLQAEANWARISGFILLLLALLPSLLLALSFHSIGRLLMITLIVLCALGMHALWMGYTPQPQG
ncbi:MAG: hypothetical protein JNN07_21265 [Verrucomicrobiales bacterium]|nr:hypothetical protein [Verrucomicrobiales bacterium]